MKFKIICVICNNEFESDNDKSKLCSAECRKINASNYSKEYRAKNKIKLSAQKKEYRNRQENKDKMSLYLKEYRSKNKFTASEYSKKYRLENKDKLKIKKSEYHHKNKERLKIYREERCEFYFNYQKKYNKEYYKKNKEKIISDAVKYKKHRRATDPSVRIRDNISSQISHGIKHNKKCSSMEYINYTVPELMIKLESMFLNGMSWDNYGKVWQIDHIRPVMSFNLINNDGTINKEEVIKCWDINNLQPLFTLDNIKKSSWYIVGDLVHKYRNGKIIKTIGISKYMELYGGI